MTIKKNNHGLSQPELSLIKNVLLTNVDITRVGVFGSRANGKYKDYSDIDLVLYGNLDERAISSINTLFDESSIGLSVDVKGYSTIEYPPLKRHIDESVRILFDFTQSSKA